jgi:uncharacterized protein YbaP (TraB family)
MSRTPFSRRLAAAAACAAALLSAASAAQADPALWRVKGPAAEVDLFGSIHLLSAATNWETPALLAELARADQVWFEIPLGPQAQASMIPLVRAKGLQPPGQTLSAQIGPELTARVRALAAREGVDFTVLDRFRPWFAELTLTVSFYEHQGYREDLGVEQVIDKAVPPTVTRGAFETVAEQIDLFADDPPAEQVASLKETLDEIGKDPDTFARAADAWRRGDVRGIEREVVDPVRKEDEALYDRLIVARNRRFAARIEQLLQGRGRVFVVVGAGHLVGPEGVPALLRKDGYAVSGP